MEFNFIVRVTFERTEGKFASRNELETQLTEEIESFLSAITLEGENGGMYEATDTEVTNAGS